MKIYLAARYSRRDELNGYRAQLEARGYAVTSRWLAGTHELDDRGLSVEASDAERRRFAQEDLWDLGAAGLAIAFTESPRATNTRGGRHVELGYALGRGIPVVVIGPAENVFCCLPTVGRYADWPAWLSDMGRWLAKNVGPVCRVCRCTDDQACPGGCYWFEPDLCSVCASAPAIGETTAAEVAALAGHLARTDIKPVTQ